MFNLQVVGQLLSSAIILLSGPVVILLLALKKGKTNLHFWIFYWINNNLKDIIMFNLQVVGQLLSSAIILLSGPVVILLLALKKGNL